MVENLKASGEMTLENGQIVNWEFTKKLGKHLKFLNFDTLDFDRISNTFKIEDKKIITPDIAVRTSFCDITANGITGFDNTVDYTINLILDEKTSEKAAQQLSTLAEFFSGRTGQLEFTVKATGTFLSPSFKLDTSTAEKQLKESLKQELKKEATKFLDKQTGDELKKKGKKLLDKIFK